MILVSIASSSCNGGQIHSETAGTSTEMSSSASAGDAGVTAASNSTVTVTEGSGTTVECAETPSDMSPCNVGCQNCPPSEKCTFVSEDQTACQPIPDNPAAVGERCDADNVCAKGATCVSYPFSNEGHCIEYCRGSEGSWQCSDPATRCLVLGNRPVCAPVCDPRKTGQCELDCRAIDTDCPSWGCFPMTDHGTVTCLPDPEESGPIGAPCPFNECANGLFCGPPGRVLGCGADTPCCTPYCDVKTSVCSEGTACESVFVSGQAPQGLEDLGACLTPT